MENKKIKDGIIQLISDITESDVKDIKREAVKVDFIQGVNVDSLMALEIVAALEKKYKIEIKEENLPKLGTIDDMVTLVDKLIKEKKEERKGKETIIIKSKSKMKTLKGKKKPLRREGIKR